MRKLLFLCLLFPCIASSQDTVYSLQDYLKIGLEQNFDIQIVRNKQEISDNNSSIGSAGYLPQLDLNSGYSGTLNTTEQYLTSGDIQKSNNVHNQTLNAAINLNWTIFEGFNIKANYDRLQELQKLGEYNTRLTIEEFISTFISEYYNFIRQGARLKNLENIVELSEERVRIVEARYEIGNLSRLDLQQAKLDLSTDRYLLIKQHEVIHTLRTRLNELLAYNDIESPFYVKDSIIDYNSALEKDVLEEKMLNDNIFLRISKQGGTLAKFDLRMLQSQNYPYLRLNGGYGYTQNMYEAYMYDQQKNYGFNYGVTLGYNLFNGFNRKRQQKNARIEISNRNIEYQQAELSLKVDFSNVWMAYHNNLKLLNLEKDNLNTARENYEIAIERYKLGQLSGIELREAQNSLFDAEERIVQAEYDTKLCEISLMQISGQIVSYLEY